MATYFFEGRVTGYIIAKNKETDIYSPVFLPVAPIIIKSYIIIPFPFDYSAVFSYFCPIVCMVARNAPW